MDWSIKGVHVIGQNLMGSREGAQFQITAYNYMRYLYLIRRVMAEQKGDQGDLIEDTGEDGDADSGVLELADEPAADNAANMDIQNGFNPHVYVLIPYFHSIFPNISYDPSGF